MNIRNLTQSMALGWQDLNGQDGNVQIKDYQIVTPDDGERSILQKIELGFFQYPKRFILNLTNQRMIQRFYGDEIDEWLNQWVTLYPDQTDYKGELVNCIRIRPTKPQMQVAPTAEPVVAGPPQ